MATLDRWRFLTTPQVIKFREMRLIGRDHAPPIVEGTGQVSMSSMNNFKFELHGTPSDVQYVRDEMYRQRQNPYDGLARMRLEGVDENGIHWAGGYTIPSAEVGNPSWIFTGELDNLITDDEGPTVAAASSTELIYVLRVNDPLAFEMTRFIQSASVGGASNNIYVLKTLGTEIAFAYEPAESTMSITVAHSPSLPTTYAEGFLGEPLRILFGQLLFPRLIARNLGNGRSVVGVLPSPKLIKEAKWAALWRPDPMKCEKKQFWQTYERLLFIIASGGGTGEEPAEGHKLTRMYEELIQASQGSRWVWAMTFASCIEALVKMLNAEEGLEAEFPPSAIEEMINHINAGPNNPKLRGTAINAVRRLSQISPIQTMRRLVARNAITDEQLSAWQGIRNAVMHGSLVSPYSSKEDDAKLLALASMVHALTREMIRQSGEPA